MSVEELEREIYSFLNSFFNIYGDNYRKLSEIFISSIEGSKQGLGDVDSGFVDKLVQIMEILRSISKDTVSYMKEFVEKYRGDYSYLYVIDCLGLPDIYALFSKACRKGFVTNLKLFINTKSVTKSFKKVFGAETLQQIATTFNGFVIWRPDTILHEISSSKHYSREELVTVLAGRMRYVEGLVPLDKTTLVISDHGYDIKRINNTYLIQHGYLKKPVFAKLSPALLFKK